MTDQITGPTSASATAQACVTCAEGLISAPVECELDHFAVAPDTIWAGIPREVVDAAHRLVIVKPRLTHAYRTPAARPLNSRLDWASLVSQFRMTRPDWRAATQDMEKALI